ncbi:MAG TPA: NAD-dependent epimerase/dehydratase family protein [Gammaproteobacteria bacterium]|nr:NAD-dependent epimerase/dehydratase family protein [Gammaproteobacteria bacterium]
MRWLITGGCGFIGTSLVRNLRNETGHSIRIIDNLSVGTRNDLASVTEFREFCADEVLGNKALSWSVEQCDLVIGDILDDDLPRTVAAGADIIVHLAANTGVAPSVDDPVKDCVTNVLGTINYLEAARINGVKRFVFASSGAPIGEVEPPIHEELAPHPVSPYGASKLAGEGYCSAYYRTYGVETVALRFGNVYGPGSTHKNSVIAKFIKQAMAGDALEIYGDGTQTRDFIYIDDLIDAICLATACDKAQGEIFQIATGNETTIENMASLLAEVLNKLMGIKVSISHSEPRKGDVKRNYSDTRKAMEVLGWNVKRSLKDGLEATVGYFIKQDNMASGKHV